MWERGSLRTLFLAALITSSTVELCAPIAQAAVTYTDEAAYLDALVAAGYVATAEGFEENATWGGVRSTISSGFATAPSVKSQGITWRSRAAPSGITTGPGAAHTGGWGVFSYPHGRPDPTNHVRDGLVATIVVPAYGVGGWLRGQGTSPQIQIVLDRGMATERAIGVGGTLTGVPTFLGVVDSVPFDTFEIEELDGTYEDQNFVFADDFTVGLSVAVPTTSTSSTTTTTSTSTTSTSTTTSTVLAVVACGDANGDGRVSATDALKVLRGSVGSEVCDPRACDVNMSGTITAVDALTILRFSTGQLVVLSCPTSSARAALGPERA